MTVSIAGHEQGIDLDPEERPEDGERTDDEDDVVEQRDERRDAELHVAEPVGDPQQDGDRADQDQDAGPGRIRSALTTGPIVVRLACALDLAEARLERA